MVHYVSIWYLKRMILSLFLVEYSLPLILTSSNTYYSYALKGVVRLILERNLCTDVQTVLDTLSWWSPSRSTVPNIKLFPAGISREIHGIPKSNASVGYSKIGALLSAPLAEPLDIDDVECETLLLGFLKQTLCRSKETLVILLYQNSKVSTCCHIKNTEHLDDIEHAFLKINRKNIRCIPKRVSSKLGIKIVTQYVGTPRTSSMIME